jgi:3-phytase
MPARFNAALAAVAAPSLALLLLPGCRAPQAVPAAAIPIRPVLATASVTDDADDPAIWVNAADPGRSLIFGTNKVKAPRGALVAFGLDGAVHQVFAGLDRPNNVDVERGLPVGGTPIDIAVATERLQHRLRVFRIAPDGSGFSDVSALDQLAVFEDRSGEAAEPMGIGLYRRPRDGALFAIVSPKNGPRDGYLQQYRLADDGAGRVKATWVRTFGRWSGINEIEAIAVDDALGYVYYADEGDGIHKYYADPDQAGAGRELAHFGRNGFLADREGVAIYERDATTGYIVCTDQLDGDSKYYVFRREGAPVNPHDHSELLKVVSGGADATDGIEIASASLPGFPHGLMVVMNSGPRNFLLYRWEDVALTGLPKLRLTAAGAAPEAGRR